MHYIDPLLLILGGILAVSGLIVAKKPDAKALIDKLMPFQAIISVLLLIFGVWDLIQALRVHLFSMFGVAPVLAIVMVAYIVSSILLGLMFGMPMVAKLSPSGAAKGAEMGKKMAPYQTLIGIVGIISGLLAILFVAGILKPM
jgi:hypothetical protein